MFRHPAAWSLALSLALTGCAAAPAVPIASAAGAAGVGGGAAASGSTSAVAAAGALGGGLVGATIGKKIEREDREKAAAAERQALSRNEPVAWTGTKGGTRGKVAPTSSYVDAGGRLCREFSETVTIDGREEAATGLACQQPDGEWRLVSPSSGVPR
jgi:surface antigen